MLMLMSFDWLDSVGLLLRHRHLAAAVDVDRPRIGLDVARRRLKVGGALLKQRDFSLGERLVDGKRRRRETLHLEKVLGILARLHGDVIAKQQQQLLFEVGERLVVEHRKKRLKVAVPHRLVLPHLAAENQRRQHNAFPVLRRESHALA